MMGSKHHGATRARADGPSPQWLLPQEVPVVAPRRARLSGQSGKGRARNFLARLVLGAPLDATRDEWTAALRALNEGDAPMDRVVDWMFESNPRAARTSFEQALTRGIDTVEGAPAPLREFFDHIDRAPSWLDRDLLAHGARFAQTCGEALLYVARDFALMSGYAHFNSMNQTLAVTGVLASGVSKRLGETGKWLNDVAPPDGLERFGEGFVNTIRVRLVHALVRRAVLTKHDWDLATWGIPINQLDMVATYLAFGPLTVVGVRAFGVPVSRKDSRAMVHLWRYVGWLSGVEDKWLASTEREGLRRLRHIAMTNRLPDDKVRLLGTALLAEPLSRRLPRLERAPWLTWLARRYLYHKHLSNAALVLGLKKRRHLGLPTLAVPWYPLLSAPLRFFVHVAHRLFGDAGIERLRRRGHTRQRRLITSYLGYHPARIIHPTPDHPAHLG